MQLEVIIVIDGPDPEMMRVLRNVNDDRLRLIMLDENLGGAEARNIGVRAARGEWIAFLDDDDEWMPEKLERQMERAVGLRTRYPVLSSRLLARGRESERVLPRRLYTCGEKIADYLFCRKKFSYGDGMLQTSTLLTKRNLLLEIPFQMGLKRHQDWDWLLKVTARTDVEIVMLPEVLTVMHVEGQGDSVSRGADWRPSFEWVKAMRPRMSSAAYSFFITTECISRARICRAGVGVYLRLLWECFRRGQPGVRQMTLFAFFWMVPDGLSRRLRNSPIQTTSRMGCSQT